MEPYTFREDQGQTTKVILQNGLTVIVREQQAVPLASITTFVKAGYFDEDDRISGISHVIEHMFFKGTVEAACRRDCARDAGARRVSERLHVLRPDRLPHRGPGGEREEGTRDSGRRALAFDIRCGRIEARNRSRASGKQSQARQSVGRDFGEALCDGVPAASHEAVANRHA